MIGLLCCSLTGHVENRLNINFEANQGFKAKTTHRLLPKGARVTLLKSQNGSFEDSSTGKGGTYIVETPSLVNEKNNHQILFLSPGESSIMLSPKLKVKASQLSFNLFKTTNSDPNIRLGLSIVDLQGNEKKLSSSPINPSVKPQNFSVPVNLLPGMKIKFSVINSKAVKSGLFIDNIELVSTTPKDNISSISQFTSSNHALNLKDSNSFVGLSSDSALTLKSTGKEVNVDCLHFTLKDVPKDVGNISVAVSNDYGKSWETIANRRAKEGINKVIIDRRVKSLWIKFESSKSRLLLGDISLVAAKYGKPRFPKWSSEDGDMFGVSSVKINNLTLTHGTKHNDEQALAPHFLTNSDKNYSYYIHWPKADSNILIPTVKINDNFKLNLVSTTGRFTERMCYLVWLDINGDGDFSSNELLVNSKGHSGGSEVIDFSVKVPSYAKPGKTRLRIMSIWGKNNSYGHEACKANFVSDTYGETEDYNVYLSKSNSTNPPKYASDLKGHCRGCLLSKVKLLKSGRVRVRTQAGDIDYKRVEQNHCYIEYSATLQAGMSISTSDYGLESQGGKQNCLLVKTADQPFYNESINLISAPAGETIKITMLFKAPAKSGTCKLQSKLPTTIKQPPVLFNLK